MCRVTPPGYVHEYGDTRAIRISPHASDAYRRGPVRLTDRNTTCARVARAREPDRKPVWCGGRILGAVSDRHFVKYTFLQVDPAWRRQDSARRAEDKREFLAACEDFGADHLIQSFSLVGTRGDADIMLVAETENLDRIHEFHVVLGQSGLMKWCTQPHSFLGMRKGSEYSEDKRLVPRPFRGQVPVRLPVRQDAPVVRAAGRGALAGDAGPHPDRAPVPDRSTTTRRTRSASTTRSSSSRSTPTTSARSSTSCSELRGTEASAYTLRDTPSFTCTARLARAGAECARRRADPGARRPRLTAWTTRSRTCAGPTPCSRACSTSTARPTWRATRRGPRRATTTPRSCASIAGQQLSVTRRALDLPAAGRVLRRSHAVAGGGPRRRPRRDARRRRPLAREDAVPALARRARRVGRARARPPGGARRRRGHGRARRGQGHRPVDAPTCS